MVHVHFLINKLNIEHIIALGGKKINEKFGKKQRNKEEVDVAKIQGTSDMKRIKDLKDNPLLIFVNSWSIGMVEERNPGLKLSEFGRN